MEAIADAMEARAIQDLLIMARAGSLEARMWAEAKIFNAREVAAHIAFTPRERAEFRRNLAKWAARLVVSQ
jgi:hypothetical protein